MAQSAPWVSNVIAQLNALRTKWARRGPPQRFRSTAFERSQASHSKGREPPSLPRSNQSGGKGGFSLGHDKFEFSQFSAGDSNPSWSGPITSLICMTPEWKKDWSIENLKGIFIGGLRGNLMIEPLMAKLASTTQAIDLARQIDYKKNPIKQWYAKGILDSGQFSQIGKQLGGSRDFVSARGSVLITKPTMEKIQVRKDEGLRFSCDENSFYTLLQEEEVDDDPVKEEYGSQEDETPQHELLEISM
ncbi:hypothetical protein ACLOJK_024498 [Asimina triloba]